MHWSAARAAPILVAVGRDSAAAIARTTALIQERQVREELAERIAARMSLSREQVTRMLSKDSTLDEIWKDYMLCRETVDRLRAVLSTGDARVAEYVSHAASLEEELMRRVQELR